MSSTNGSKTTKRKQRDKRGGRNKAANHSELCYVGDGARDKLIQAVADAYCNGDKMESKCKISDILVKLARQRGVTAKVVLPNSPSYCFRDYRDDEDHSGADDFDALDGSGALLIHFGPEFILRELD